MTDAREIIANGLTNHGLTFPPPDAVAVHLLNHLSAAGFRIIGPDEVDQLRDDIHVAIMSMSGDCEAHHRIAFNHLDRAYRAIGRKA